LHFLSHDLRSPVVSILALLEHYRSGNAQQLKGDGQLREVLTEIEQYARKNLSFAESFLHLARAEIVGDSKFDLCDMHSVVDNALMMTRQQALAKNIRVTVDRTMDDLWVWGDGELLERVVVNLLSNAVKYSQSDTEIDFSVHTRNEEVVLKVTDQGIGIGANELKRIFQRFHRAAGSLPVSGAGLGLHFVDTVCKKHGGSIDVTSELGTGSTFTMVLPLCENHFDE
jgi:signal transduction histidine kinase